MPIYEYECEVHGKFETILSFKDRKDSYPCPFKGCDSFCNILVSAPSMQPDKHWAGSFTPSGDYVTSAKQFKERTKHLVPADRDTMEYAAKLPAKRKQEREEKNDKRIREFLAKELANVTID